MRNREKKWTCGCVVMQRREEMKLSCWVQPSCVAMKRRKRWSCVVDVNRSIRKELELRLHWMNGWREGRWGCVVEKGLGFLNIITKSINPSNELKLMANISRTNRFSFLHRSNVAGSGGCVFSAPHRCSSHHQPLLITAKHS